MKKALSLLLTLVMLVTSLGIGTTAYASETKLATYIAKQIKNAGDYLVDESQSFGVDEAVDFLIYLKANALTSTQKNNFANAVEKNLKDNKGKIVGTYGENFGTYGAVIQSLTKLGYSASNFRGYNITKSFNALDINSDCNPYYYQYAIEVAGKERALKLCDVLIKNYYVKGSGLNYWGFSCDNTGRFLASIAKYKSNYSEYVKDAKAVIKAYETNNGCYGDSQYVTYANADSTAMALLGFSAVGDTAQAFKYYKMLIENFQSKTAGVFNYDGKANAYATKDALIALEAYQDLVIKTNYEHPQEVEKKTTVKATCTADGKHTYTCLICGKTRTVAIKKLGHSYTKKVTKAPTSSATGVMTHTCSRCGKKYTTTLAKLVKTSIVKLNAKSKAFYVSWKTSNSVSGYQIQYATNSKFTNAKLINMGKSTYYGRTQKNLKAKQKYFVRVRTYKIINGKKYYSAWSGYKTVTTKA